MNDPEKTPESFRGVDLDSEMEEVMDKLKDDINAFLWTRLPPTLTLDEAEEIAVEMTTKIYTRWEEEVVKARKAS